MFIGSEYKLREDREAASETTLGHKIIVIMERVLSHTETRYRGGAVEVEETRYRGGRVGITSYHYTLMCLVDGDDSAEIIENQLQSEVTAGLYIFNRDPYRPGA
jgi:hypothetical protein